MYANLFYRDDIHLEMRVVSKGNVLSAQILTLWIPSEEQSTQIIVCMNSVQRVQPNNYYEFECLFSFVSNQCIDCKIMQNWPIWGEKKLFHMPSMCESEKWNTKHIMYERQIVICWAKMWFCLFVCSTGRSVWRHTWILMGPDLKKMLKPG